MVSVVLVLCTLQLYKVVFGHLYLVWQYAHKQNNIGLTLFIWTPQYNIIEDWYHVIARK